MWRYLPRTERLAFPTLSPSEQGAHFRTLIKAQKGYYYLEEGLLHYSLEGLTRLISLSLTGERIVALGKSSKNLLLLTNQRKAYTFYPLDQRIEERAIVIKPFLVRG